MTEGPSMEHAPAEAARPQEHGRRINAYLVVFAALTVFTLISFVVNSAVRKDGYIHRHVFAIQNPGPVSPSSSW